MMLCMFVLAGIKADHGRDPEQLLKLAFVYNFARFTYWPDDTRQTDAPLLLCTVGEDGLVDALGDLNDKPVHNRPLRVQRVREELVPETCDMLYVAISERGSYRSFVAVSDNEALLTVSELPGFVKAGGIIELFHEKGRTGFDINFDAARRGGLQISSQLLGLARHVEMREPQ